MSILGEARKRLEKANMIKRPMQERYVSTRLPYDTGEEPSCPEGYHYDPVARVCAPDIVTPKTPAPIPVDQGGDDHDPGIHGMTILTSLILQTTSGYTGRYCKEVPQQESCSDLHSWHINMLDAGLHLKKNGIQGLLRLRMQVARA